MDENLKLKEELAILKAEKEAIRQRVQNKIQDLLDNSGSLDAILSEFEVDIQKTEREIKELESMVYSLEPIRATAKKNQEIISELKEKREQRKLEVEKLQKGTI